MRGNMDIRTWAIRVTVLLALIGLAACGRQARVDPGPDEFSVQPQAALVDPADFSTLPNPGGQSRTDSSGVAAGIVALGGNPAAANPQAIGSVNATGGRGGGFFARLFGGGNKAGTALDPAAEAARLRALGIAVLGGN